MDDKWFRIGMACNQNTVAQAQSENPTAKYLQDIYFCRNVGSEHLAEKVQVSTPFNLPALSSGTRSSQQWNR